MTDYEELKEKIYDKQNWLLLGGMLLLIISIVLTGVIMVVSPVEKLMMWFGILMGLCTALYLAGAIYWKHLDKCLMEGKNNANKNFR